MSRSARLALGVVTLAAVLAATPSAGADHGTSAILDLPYRIAAGAGRDVEVLDFDGDGWSDIALAGGHTHDVQLILGRSDGWDAPQSIVLDLPAAWGAGSLAAGDLTGDRRDDIVVSFGGTGRVAVLRGGQDGTLGAPAAGDLHVVGDVDTTFIPTPVAAVELGDIDNNGSLDVMSSTSALVPMLNDGDGDLVAQPPVGGPVADLALARLGGDEDLDLISPHGSSGPERTGGVLVRAGGPGATFAAATSTATPREAITVDVGDMDGDGAADVAAGMYRDGVYGYSPQVLLGDAQAPTLAAPLDVVPGAVFIGSRVEVGDLTRDGFADVTVDSDRNESVLIYASDAAAQFRGRGTAWLSGGLMYSWTIADADDDGKADVVASTHDWQGDAVRIFFGAGPRVVPQRPVFAFGNHTVGTASPVLTAQITNSGPGRADGLLLLRDGDIADFSVEQNGCSGSTLAVGASCTVGVRFRPTAPGNRELVMAAIAPDSDEAYWFALTGTGVAPTAPGSAGTARGQSPAAPGTDVVRRLSGPRVLGTGRRMRVDTGYVLRCPAGGGTCRATVLLVARARPGRTAPVLARGTLRVSAGQRRRIVAPLTTAGRRALRRTRSVRAVLRVTTRRSGKAPISTQRSLTVRAPR
jgi:hypothetical protein